MPKFLYVLFVALLLASCQCGGVQRAPKAASALVANVSNASVALVYTKIIDKEVDESAPVDPDADKPRPTLEVHVYCAGIWTSHDEIVTAAHCIRGVAEVEEAGAPENVVVHYTLNSEAPQPGEEPYAIHLGKVLVYDAEHDLALLKALGNGRSIPNHGIARVADQMPGIGDDLIIVGHPKGLYFSVYKGSVAEYRSSSSGTDTLGPWIQVQAPVFFGNSGGGAFDTNGDLVGVASMVPMVGNMFAKMPMPSTAFFVDANVVRKFLADAKK